VIPTSVLTIAPLHREGTKSETGSYTIERWSWDFVVDGISLWSLWKDRDVVGVLGWVEHGIEEISVAKLQRDAEPDFPPNRVALFVCPECGDLGCGAVTTAIDRQDAVVTWSDFRWEVNWFDPHDPDSSTHKFDVGPFCFDYPAYLAVLREARSRRPFEP
jgi:hypothetical protein